VSGAANSRPPSTAASAHRVTAIRLPPRGRGNARTAVGGPYGASQPNAAVLSDTAVQLECCRSHRRVTKEGTDHRLFIRNSLGCPSANRRICRWFAETFLQKVQSDLHDILAKVEKHVSFAVPFLISKPSA
jgi:hypothetical protein